MSFIPPLFDITINQNATFELGLSITDLDGNGIDITNWGFSGSIKHKFNDAVPVVNFTIDKVNAVGGALTINLTPTETRLLTSQHNNYDVLAIKPDTKVYRIIEGSVTVRPAVTTPS
jgi:hypothetical protein